MKTLKKKKPIKTSPADDVKKECAESKAIFENVGTSSRLIVKNLPCGKKTRWDEDKVRAHFSKFGTLTDVRLKVNEKTGACKFAFVGFSSAENCQEAIKKMDGAYIGGSKLTVEECKPLTNDRTAVTKQITLNKLKKEKQNRKRPIDDDDEEEEDGEEGDKETNVDSLIEKRILDTGRLFLRNLPFVCSEEQIRQHFEPFGPLAELECVVDNAGKCKGYALCTFIFPEHAVAAWKALDGTVFMGRMLHIIAGEEKRVRTNGETTVDDNAHDGCQSAFQRERHQKRKTDDAKETPTRCTWNALFLGTDAVAETLADNYELEKRDLLLVEGNQQNSAAVRMAMAEARLVRETRKFLLDNGVRLDAFAHRRHPLAKGDNANDEDGGATKMRRSKTTILVKNLDASREGKKEWLCSLFERFGAVKTVLVPPVHGITALVEMTNARDAKCAFEALAYSKKHTPQGGGRPMFLEWAPSDVFDQAHPLRAIGQYGYQQKGQYAAADDGDEQSPAENGRKGGNNRTTKMDNEREEANLEQKQKGGEQEEEKKEESEDEKHTKILVRNVPFQANVEELTQLFSAFGELKFIRMPKKPGSEGHRGFCFVEFLSASDSRRAMDGLVHSTHLYGRRLVLEWAKPSEESVDEKRERTQDRMAMAAGVVGQRMKKRPKMRSF